MLYPNIFTLHGYNSHVLLIGKLYTKMSIQKAAINTPPASMELHTRIRAAFILNGTTFTRWCKENNVDPQNARQCIMGVWNGPKGRELRAKIIEASGVRAIN